ncbi:MAG: adenylate/guanylate cyclase domain-containing protein [Saccharofermentans sp.]|nr:adenylate/guanylate cyclase domain-containing protein [Saccharofermentans sp.]
MKSSVRHLLISLVISLGITSVISTGLIQRPDKWVQDALYQRPSTPSSDIVIIGIDEDALAELGPYNTWDRSIMSSALEVLGQDPDNEPCVVAVDTLYISNTDEVNDIRLAEAASKLDNVVFGSAATFGTSYEYTNGITTTNNYSVLNYEIPYEGLNNVAFVGHINAMEDIDGIMRHALWYIEPKDGGRVYSMAYTAASIYMEAHGESIDEPPINSRGQFYVPFTAKPFTYYDGFSIADLINGSIPESYFKDKIVLIGPYASGLQDAYFTPIDRSTQMFGVEFQANVIQSFIDGNFKKEVTNLPQIIVLFIITTALLYMFFYSKIRIATIEVVIAVILSLLLTSGAYSIGYVLHPLWIPVSALITYVIGIVNRYHIAKAEKIAVTKSFERYVAPDIVNDILKSNQKNLALGGKTYDISVLFVDIRGFTTMSERIDPEKVVYILNKYLSKCVEIIDSNHGTLDKFVGDAVMAFWGAPLPQENSIFNSCKAALEIVRGVENISSELKEEMGEEIHVGVGVHYGKAVVGNMGSDRRMDYTAIGDTVNTAARLESNAPAGTVYISRIVADKLGTKAKTTTLGNSIKLKGKTDGFEVLRLDDLED